MLLIHVGLVEGRRGGGKVVRILLLVEGQEESPGKSTPSEPLPKREMKDLYGEGDGTLKGDR